MKNGVDFDANSVITALNDGVGIKIDELEKGYSSEGSDVVYGELYVDYTTADNKESLVQKSWGLMDVVSKDPGLSVVNGEIRVTADGKVVLSDGENTVRIIIRNYERLLAEELNAYGVGIEVLEGSVPAGSEVQYTALDKEATASLIEKYNIDSDEKGIEHAAFDVSIAMPEGQEFKEEGSYRVTVQLPDEVDENAEEYTLYHIHDGEVEELPVEVVEGKVVFTTNSFSEFVLGFTVEFHNGDAEYVLQGMGSVLLSEILAAVDVDFTIGEVEDAVFSNPELIDVEAVEGDWRLTSLRPFLTQESLTLTLVDGRKIVIDVTDAIDVHTDLKDFLHAEDTDPVAVIFTINGQEVGADAPKVRVGDSYSLTLNFHEINNGAQFPIDGTVMSYELPDALADVQNLSGTHSQFSMELGTDDKGQPIMLDGNEIWVEEVGGKKVVKVKWNTSSPNFGELISAGDAHLQVVIQGKMTSASGTIDFGAGITRDVEPDNSHGLTVSKSGSYDADTGKVNYTITVNSTGTNEDVTVTDTIRGTALVNPSQATYTITRADGTKVTGTCDFSSKTLNKNFGTLNNGDKIEIHYSTDIDTTQLTGRGTAEQTVNDVEVKNKDNEGEPDPISTNLENQINWLSFGKTGEEIAEGSSGNTKIVEWTITANEKMLTSLAGKTIKDTITTPEVMKYIQSGTYGGISVEVYDQNGKVDTRNISWGTNGLTAYDPSTWTYTVPTGDGNYKYVIKYRTEVDVSGRINALGVSNDVEIEGIKQQGYTNVQPGADNVELHKIHDSSTVTRQHTDWQVYFDVPANGLSSAVLEDYLPVANVNGVNVFDALDVSQYTDGIQITGLNTTELYGKPYEKYTLEVDYSNTGAPMFRIRFQKLDTETGEYVDGLMSGATRTITVNYRTNISEELVTLLMLNPAAE